MLPMMYNDLAIATFQTLYMVFLSTLFACLLGLPLGVSLYTSANIKPNLVLNKFLSAIINLSRSIPFIILLVALIPFTRIIIGSAIGINAAIVPLTIGAAPFFARLVDNVCQNLPKGLIDAGHAMGASTLQMIFKIILPEATPALINAVTVTAITLVNYSAMAGTVGGGGLGDLAIRYGYQRFNVIVMLATVAILIVIVQSIQMLGDKLSQKYSEM